MKVKDYTNRPTKGSKAVAEALNVYLASLEVYYFNLLGYHWHVTGKAFFTVHEQIEKMYRGVAEQIDEVAERILQLDAVPVRKMAEIQKLSEIKEAEIVSAPEKIMAEILATYKILTQIERDLLDKADSAGDEVTADLITGYLAEREKTAWMLVQFNQ